MQDDKIIRLHQLDTFKTIYNALLEKNFLNKTTYEYKKELSLGSNGKVCLGKFYVYDSNITIHISSTTSITYNATIVIATQNYLIKQVKVYGDAQNIITPLLSIVASNTTSGSANYRMLEVYANLSGWSKNLVHIQGVNLIDNNNHTGAFDILKNVTTIPTGTYTNIINDLTAKLNSKVDKISGKGLSTNDFTNSYKTQLDELETFVNGKIDDYSAYVDTFKQDKLVSGTNIKTINGESLLGSGNITISSDGNSSSNEWVSLNSFGILGNTITPDLNQGDIIISINIETLFSVLGREIKEMYISFYNSADKLRYVSDTINLAKLYVYANNNNYVVYGGQYKTGGDAGISPGEIDFVVRYDTGLLDVLLHHYSGSYTFSTVVYVR